MKYPTFPVSIIETFSNPSPEVPYVILREEQSYQGGGDFSDDTTPIIAFYGRVREYPRKLRTNDVNRGTGLIAIATKLLMINAVNIDISSNDSVVEGIDNGDGTATPKTGVPIYTIVDKREYDSTIQCDLKEIES